MNEIKGIENFNNLKVGDKVYWKNEKKPYTIKARNERYIIVVKMMFGKPCYSILDLKEGICSTNDFIFNPYDYSVQDDIDKSLVDLEKEEYELSRRNQAEILNVINGYKIINTQ